MIDDAGRSYLVGLTIKTKADENQFGRGEGSEVVEVDPRYLVSRLVLAGQSVPHLLRHLVEVGPPDCPVRIDNATDRIASIRVGDQWKRQDEIAEGDLKAVQILIDAYPGRVRAKELKERSGLASPWQNLLKLKHNADSDWPSTIHVPGKHARTGYRLVVPGEQIPQIPTTDPQHPTK